MMRSALAIGVVATAYGFDSAVPRDFEPQGVDKLHMEVGKSIEIAFNSGGELSQVVSLLADDAEFCFPYPYCVNKAEAFDFLNKLDAQLSDTYMIPVLPNLMGTDPGFNGVPTTRTVTTEHAGSMWGLATAMFFPDQCTDSEGTCNEPNGNGGCLISDVSYITWELEGGATASAAEVSRLNVFFDTQDRLSTLRACPQAIDPSTVMLSAFSAPSKQEADKTRESIDKNFRTIVEGTKLPSSEPTWASVWSKTMNDDTKFCDPFPTTCLTGGDAVTKFFEGFVPYVSRGIVYAVTPFVISGHVAVGVSTWTDVQRGNGCIAQHYQLGQFELADDGKTFSVVDIWYSSEAYNYERSKCKTPDSFKK